MIRTIANLVEIAIVVLVLAVVAREPRAATRLMGGPAPDEQLRFAAWMGDYEGTNDALRDGAALDARDEVGGTALAYAATSGRVNVVQQLIDLGADVNGVDRYKYTPLM